MTEDLLAKEVEFYRLNKELDQKTRDLMNEVNYVINMQDEKVKEFSKNAAITSKESNCKISGKQNSQSSQNRIDQSLLKYNGEEISSKKENGLVSKTVVNVFKAKVEMLQNELETMRKEYKKKCDYCKEMELEHKKFGDLKNKLQNEIESLKDTIKKLDNNNNDLQSQHQTLHTENVALKKDSDGLNKQIKLLNQQLSNYETRLNRCLENNEKYRSTLKCSEIEEKELRNQIRRLQEDKTLAIKNLEKQHSELVQAFKKQMLLIDNLKRQNACLIASGQLQFTQEDFTRLLDRKPDCL